MRCADSTQDLVFWCRSAVAKMQASAKLHLARSDAVAAAPDAHKRAVVAAAQIRVKKNADRARDERTKRTAPDPRTPRLLKELPAPPWVDWTVMAAKNGQAGLADGAGPRRIHSEGSPSGGSRPRTSTGRPAKT